MKNKVGKTFTLETRLDPRLAGRLIEYFDVMTVYYSKIFCHLWQMVNRCSIDILGSGLKSVTNTYLQNKFCISKRFANAVISDVKGRYKAVAELKKYELSIMEAKKERLIGRIEILKQYINAKKIVIGRADFLTLEVYRKRKQSLYQKQCRLNRLGHKIDKLKSAIAHNKYSICFGTKKLFLAQYHLEENGFSCHEKWLQAFRNNRDKYVFYLGSADETAGNQMFQLFPVAGADDAFRIRVRSIFDWDKKECLGYCPDERYISGACRFKYKFFTDYLRNHLSGENRIAVSYRIVRKNRKFYLQAMFTYSPENSSRVYTTKTYGVVGLDYNDGFIQAAETDFAGNLVGLKKYNLLFHGTGNKAKSEICEVVSKIVKDCISKGKDLVIENLDFKKKKAQTYSSCSFRNKKYNKMIHQFDYTRYKEVIDNSCCRNNVNLVLVNPANTSKIAGKKYCSSMKLGIHQGAAYVISRRGQGFKDYLNKKGKIKQIA